MSSGTLASRRQAHVRWMGEADVGRPIADPTGCSRRKLEVWKEEYLEGIVECHRRQPAKSEVDYRSVHGQASLYVGLHRPLELLRPGKGQSA